MSNATSKMVKVCGDCGEKLLWTGCTPYGESYMCVNRLCKGVTPLHPKIVSRSEGVTRVCEVCGKVLDGYSNKRTCSDKCRKKLSRAIVKDGQNEKI